MVRPSTPADVLGAEASSNLARSRTLGMRTKLLYGVGAIVDGVTAASLTYFLLFYLTAVCGLSGTLAGTASLMALMVDALADPAIGLISDNTRTRLGRRVPFLLAIPIPLAAFFVILFSIPSSLRGLALFAYATAGSMMLRVTISLFTLPFYAAGAELTDDYAERSSVVSWRIVCLMLGNFCAIALGLGLFMAGPSGLLNRAAYRPFAWSCAALIVVAGLISALAVRRELPRLHPGRPVSGGIVRQFMRETPEVFRNRSFIILSSAAAIFFIAQGVSGALTIYANRYFWGLSSQAVQVVILATTLGPFLGAPLTAVLSRVVEKRRLTISYFVVFCLALLWPPIARIAGLLPLTGAPLVALLAGNGLFGGAALVGGAIGFQSMMADAADEHEHLFGVRREGLFFSSLTLAVKAASGVGSFVAGVALDVIGFPSQIASKGADLHLSASIIRNLGIVAGPLPAGIILLAPMVLLGYRLTKTKHEAILADLGRGTPRSR